MVKTPMGVILLENVPENAVVELDGDNITVTPSVGQLFVWMAASLQSWGLAGDIRRIEIDARVGGKFFFSDMRDGTEARHWGSYLELDPQKKSCSRGSSMKAKVLIPPL
jgi:Activator of Hsp90 ATPase homolog 1-like protein